MDMPFGGTPDHLPIGPYRIAIGSTLLLIHVHVCTCMFNFGWEESDGLSGEEQRTHSLPPDSQHCTDLPAIYVYI